MSNFFEHINKVLADLNLSTETTFAAMTDSIHIKIKQSINSINAEIIQSNSERWAFRERDTSFVIVEGQNEYSAPYGPIECIMLEGVAKPLVFEPDWRELDFTVTGIPIKYWVYQGQIGLYPKPSSRAAGKKVTVYYMTDYLATSNPSVLPVTNKEEMTEEKDVSIIPVKYEKVLLYGACWDFKGRPEQGRYQHYQVRYRNWVNLMKQEYTVNAGQGASFQYGSMINSSLEEEFFRWDR